MSVGITQVGISQGTVFSLLRNVIDLAWSFSQPWIQIDIEDVQKDGLHYSKIGYSKSRI